MRWSFLVEMLKLGWVLVHMWVTLTVTLDLYVSHEAKEKKGFHIFRLHNI